MTAKPRPLEIPGPILEEVYAVARRAFPFECCGWLVGARAGSSVSRVRRCVNAQGSGTHPTKPERGAETAYVFTGADLLDLNRSLDTEEPARIIYHSHPNGQAYLSETDRGVATSPWGGGPAYPVQQLVVGIDAQRVVEAALFDWYDEANGFVEIARYSGADI
ncbi:MAG TPA: Mov34/MPN/PAD-1 family protein [Dehalococcoidia bacterium]|nr:Mov34/MPN/PAD-1 family protein [Dehalococcoidia bacterium]